MDTRLAILSGTAFLGVAIGGLLIADPGVANSVNPAGLFGGEGDEHEYEDDDGEHDDDDRDDEDHERDEDEHEEDEDGDDESTRSSDVRFAFDGRGDHEDDD